jgi:hypothetical protein
LPSQITQGVLAFKKGRIKTHVVDNINGALGFVAAWIYRRHWRRLDTPASSRGFGDLDSAIDYRKTRGSVTLR